MSKDVCCRATGKFFCPLEAAIAATCVVLGALISVETSCRGLCPERFQHTFAKDGLGALFIAKLGSIICEDRGAVLVAHKIECPYCGPLMNILNRRKKNVTVRG